MGKHPRDLLSSLSSSSDPKIMLIDVLDQRLPPPVDQKVIQDILLASTVSFPCLQSNPKSRPTMQYASQEFLITRKTPLTADINVDKLLALLHRSFNACRFAFRKTTMLNHQFKWNGNVEVDMIKVKMTRYSAKSNIQEIEPPIK
ncbi:hypothetical protein CUMW_283360, partial [Citrus unshiu]